MPIVDLFRYYNDIFIPIYAEVVARRQAKPRQIANEIENAFSHLTSYHLSDCDLDKKSNLNKAIGHIQRATLDCQKILWLTLITDAAYLEKGDGLLEHASNVSLDTAVAQYKLIQKLGIEARFIESQNTGISLAVRLEFYQNAIEQHKKFDDMIDIVKARMFANRQKKFSLKQFAINNAVGFMIGVVAGIIGNYFYAKLFSPDRASVSIQSPGMPPNTLENK